MEGLEHLHFDIKRILRRIEYNKLVDESGAGCAMIMNDTELSEKTWTAIGMNQKSRRSLSGAGRPDQSEEDKELRVRIRGKFHRMNINAKVIICDACFGKIGDFNQNKNVRQAKCRDCASHITKDDTATTQNHYQKLKINGYDKEFITQLFSSYNKETLKKIHEKMIENDKKKDD